MIGLQCSYACDIPRLAFCEHVPDDVRVMSFVQLGRAVILALVTHIWSDIPLLRYFAAPVVSTLNHSAFDFIYLNSMENSSFVGQLTVLRHTISRPRLNIPHA